MTQKQPRDPVKTLLIALVRLIAALLVVIAVSGCVAVRPWQRGLLASPAMQFEMAPLVDAQEKSILEITEGGTFSSAGPGSAGAGCGCH